jgi:hypothetical protein
MKLNLIQERIQELFANFVTEMRVAKGMNRGDINHISGIILLPKSADSCYLRVITTAISGLGFSIAGRYLGHAIFPHFVEMVPVPPVKKIGYERCGCAVTHVLGLLRCAALVSGCGL